MLGFVVWFCLVVAVCSTVAAVYVCACCTLLTCAWDKPTNRVRTVDRVRVNGLHGL